MGRRGRGARPLGKPIPRRHLPWKKRTLTRVERVIAFLQWLPITKGVFEGQRMKLLPEQIEFVHAIYSRAPVRIAVLSERITAKRVCCVDSRCVTC